MRTEISAFDYDTRFGTMLLLVCFTDEQSPEIDPLAIVEIIHDLRRVDIEIDAVFMPDLALEQYPSELAGVAAMLESEEKIPVLSRSVHHRLVSNAREILSMNREVSLLEDTISV